MSFESFVSAHAAVLWLTFGIAVVMGAVVNKTNFCTMGAVSDLVNMGDSSRIRAWLLAMAVAILGVTLIEAAGLFTVDASRPPYRGGSFAWLEYIIGGVMFGVGMTLGSGCGNKTLVRIGGGNLKSIIVFIVISICAYFMVNPFPGTDDTLYSTLFYPWTNLTTVSLAGKQDLGSLVSAASGADVATMRLIFGLLVCAGILLFVFKSEDFRQSADSKLAGIVVGACIIAAWYVSADFATISADGEIYSWVNYASDDVWTMVEDSAAPSGVAVQSYSFINPIGEMTGYLVNGMEGWKGNTLTYGMVATFGVIIGSLLWAVISKGFRIEWFVDMKDFITHLIGGALMGVGGILAVGCTIGQAVTGVSTLALGSFMVFGSIVFGSAMTMKIQYYRLVYEDEATFGKAFITALVDMKVLPASLRKLDAV